MSSKLSSINPYRLLKVSDHFGAHSRIANPEVDDEELRKVTVTEAFWKDAMPDAVRQEGFRGRPDSTNSDLYLGIREFIPHYQFQMRDFARQAGTRFVLKASGHPDLQAVTSGMKLSFNDHTRRQHQLFGLKIAADSRLLVAPGAAYSIVPVNTSETYVWTVQQGLTVASSAAGH